MGKIQFKTKRKYTITEIIALAVGIAVAVCVSLFAPKLFPQKPLIDKVLVEIAGEYNKYLPMMIDEFTRIDNMTALPNKTVQYNYTLMNLETSMIDTLDTKRNLTPNIINQIKTNSQMGYFRENKITINYFYKDIDGNYLFAIIVTPDQYQ